MAAATRPAAASPVSPAQRAAAFNAATRQKFVMVPVPDAFVAGQIQRVILPKVGLLSRVFLNFSGTLTVVVGAGTSTAAIRSPWDIAKRIRLLANSTLPIHDTSGFGAYVANLLSQTVGVWRRPGSFATAFTVADTPQYEPPAIPEAARFAVANGANAIDFTIELPIKLTEQDPIGLIIAQNPQTQLTVEIQNGTIADLTTLAGGATATMTGQWSIGIEYFDAPADPGAMPDLTFVHVWQEQRLPVAATGQFQVNLLTGDTYLRVAHIVQLNSALDSADIDTGKLILNQADTPYTYDRWLWQYLHRMRYGKDLGAGILVHDFFVPQTQRDMINSALYSDLRTELDINAAAVLGGGGTDLVDVVVEKLVQVG